MIQNHRSWVFKENAKFVDMFKNKFVQKDDICVSHHLPSYQLVNKQYKCDISNQFFVTEMEKYMQTIEPRAWNFGHTHWKTEMNIHKTFCTSNPVGYPREPSSVYFDESYVFEI